MTGEPKQDWKAGAAGLIDSIEDAAPPIPTAANDAGEPCPVTPLGYQGRKYFILTQRGDVLGLTSRELTRYETYTEVFGGKMKWLFDSFRKDDDKGGLALQTACKWFVEHCQQRGYYDEGRIRRVGTFRDRHGVTVHCGDMVRLASGAWEAPGEHGRDIYIGSLPIPRPMCEAPASPEPSREILALLGTWNWLAPQIAPRLVLGIVGCGFVCGALDWRPHVCLTGFKGTGKTWLDTFLKEIYGPGYYVQTSEGSPAYIRDTLNGSSRPVFLDEFEQDAGDYSHMLVKLAKLASSRFQSGVGRSSADRVTRETKIDACFLFSGVNPPPLDPSQAGRITILDLQPFADPDADDAAAVQEGCKRLAQHGPALFGRMIERFQSLHANIEVYRHELMAAGCDSRTTDQFSHLLAAADTLLSNDLVTVEHCRPMVARLKDAGLIREAAEDDEGAICAEHLLTTALRSDDRTLNGRTVADLVQLVQADANVYSGPRELLKRHGLNCVDHIGHAHLIVANRHRALSQIFEGTRWQGGGWANTLGKHKGAMRNRDSVRFHGVKSRAVWIPVEFLLEPEPAPEERGPMDGATPATPDAE